MFRRCFFWLPVVHLLILGACYLDMLFDFSTDGSSEGNLGAWIYIFFMLPSMYVSDALGYGQGFPPNILIAIPLQTIGLAVVGALIDRFVRTARES